MGNIVYTILNSVISVILINSKVCADRNHLKFQSAADLAASSASEKLKVAVITFYL